MNYSRWARLTYKWLLKGYWVSKVGGWCKNKHSFQEEKMELLVSFFKIFLIYILLPLGTVKLLFKYTFLKKFSSTSIEKNLGAIIIVVMLLSIYFIERSIGTL